MTDTSTGTAAKADPKKAKWQALTHLSIGRNGQAGLAVPGEIVELTEEESAGFLDPGRHRIPVIRPESERDEPLPRISAARVFGAKGRPAPPPPEPGAQPLDVKNESKVIKDPGDPENAPEAHAPEVTDPDADNEGSTARTRRSRS